MEHRLIEGGGEQFLPFARSRLKSLKATGLSHASQRYEIDGVSISVRIEPGQEFIYIRGKAISSAMDSGVVEIFAFNEENPNRLLSGVLYESTYVTTYTADYSHQGASYKDVAYRTNIATDDKQIAGFLHFNNRKFEGWIPDNATEAKSFERLMVPDDLTADPPTFKPDLEQIALIGKKTTTFIVPASVFTGKCRLWVQAMYGAWNNDGDESGVMPAWTGFQNSVAPALFIRSALRDKTDYGSSDRGLLLSTNCGVFLNPVTGEHWLIVPPSATTATVFYPLISNAAGESWRKFLITESADPATTPNSALSAEDISHLEAHILAYCLPDRSKAISVLTPSVFSEKVAQSMSYGWHWNQAGTEAVIVTNETVFYGWDPIETSRALTQIESQTSVLGIQASTNEAGETVFTAAVTTGAPTRWAIDRRYWTVVHPDFANSQMYKLTDAWVKMTVVDRAVFYAYYVGNLRVECAAHITHQDYVIDTVNDPPSFTWINPVTLGMSGGFIDIITRHDMFSVSFSVGGYTTPVIPSSAMQSSTQRKSVTDKTRSDIWDGFITYLYYSITTPEVKQGDPPYELVPLPLPCNYVQVYGGEIMGCTVSELVIETHLVVGGLVAVIPANDAEAICIRCGNHERDYTSGSIQTYTSNGGAASQSSGEWIRRAWWQPGYFTYNPNGSRNAIYPQAEDRYVYSTMWALPASGANYTTTTTSATTPDDRIVCDEGFMFVDGRTINNAATFPLALTQTFLNNALDDTVLVRFHCLSGYGSKGVVIARDFGIEEGFTPADGSTYRYVIVGWT